LRCSIELNPAEGGTGFDHSQVRPEIVREHSLKHPLSHSEIPFLSELSMENPIFH
jgi:hypothetical protein